MSLPRTKPFLLGWLLIALVSIGFYNFIFYFLDLKASALLLADSVFFLVLAVWVALNRAMFHEEAKPVEAGNAEAPEEHSACKSVQLPAEAPLTLNPVYQPSATRQQFTFPLDDPNQV